MEPAFWRLVVNVCVRFDVRQLSEERRPCPRHLRQEEAQGVRGMKFPEVFVFESESVIIKKNRKKSKKIAERCWTTNRLITETTRLAP